MLNQDLSRQPSAGAMATSREAISPQGVAKPADSENRSCRQEMFKTVLDQYNSYLNFAIEISHKCIALAFVFSGVFYTLHNLKDCVNFSPFARWSIIGIGVTVLGIFFWMQIQYIRRCGRCLRYLQEKEATNGGFTLLDLGILTGKCTHEHTRIIILWSVVFAIILGFVLVNVYRQPSSCTTTIVPFDLALVSLPEAT